MNKDLQQTLEQILQAVEERSTVGAYTQAARELDAYSSQLRSLRVVLLSSYTIDPLVPYIKVEAARKGFAANVYVGPFNSVTQELLNPTSGCVTHKPDVIFIAQQLSELRPTLANDFLALNEAAIEQQIESVVSDLTATLTEFRKANSAAVVVHNFSMQQYPLLGIYEAMAPQSQTEAIRKLNARLADALKTIPGVYMLDYDRLCSDVGYRNWYDHKMWHLGRAPLSTQAMPPLAQAQAAFLQAICGKPRKCLVLDLDNTLWGGVIGEDGVAGIKLGQTYPGSAYRSFQQTVLQLYRQGVILAINSKNNLADVEEVFKSHPDMILKREHFASIRINWQDKPQNMREIAEELNIGIDSFVFFDDNPTERALMRQTLPELLTLEVPTDPLKYTQVLLDSRAFEKLSLTEEDRRRGEMYREQILRQDLEKSATSLEQFYEDLQMVVNIQPVDAFAFPRAVDLIHKTNQFNLTTRRHTASRLSELLADPNCGVFTMQVGDRFGDHGIVGVGIVQVEGPKATIDSMLLSCRVIGRTVETAFLSYMSDWAAERGAVEIEGEFIPTVKNAPAADFYERHGFTKISEDGVNSLWQASLIAPPFAFPVYIRLEGNTQSSVLSPQSSEPVLSATKETAA